MNKAYSVIDWQNEPAVNTPINATNLNKMDSALNTIDDRVVLMDTTKATAESVKGCISNVTYDTKTGVFVFTWGNTRELVVDLNIEKIPVSFSMSEEGIITMVTADGTEYTADIGSMIDNYDFNDSGTIEWQVRLVDGVKYVKADIIEGTITEDKLQPNFLADCRLASSSAQVASSNASNSESNSEAWANGTRNGIPVQPDDPSYHNNAKYWKDQTNVTSFAALSDVDMTNVQDGQVPKYNALTQKYEPGEAGSANAMLSTDYDADGAVKDAGGIVAYVESKLNETITSAIERSY